MIQPMPLISRGVPAFTNDDFTGAFPASQANDAVYGDTDYWRCAATPVGNANSGTLTTPVYLAYDLSGVNADQRRTIVLVWYDDCPGTGAYDAGLIANPYINLANAYTIDVNPAPGGTLPTTGWVTKTTVTGNTYHSRQHVLDMSGYNWIRINVTAAIGSASNNNVAMNMDIHDAHLGVLDSWIFYGDSITQRGLDHDDKNSIGNIVPAQINASKFAWFPVWENAAVGGWSATDMQAVLASTFLPLFPGRYAALTLGTNDANGGGILITNFQAKMQSMITSILNAGKIPVIPHIPYGTTANIIANGPTVNGYIDALIAANPGCIAGPDLWTYFQANQTLISGDGIHPTDPAGYAAYRTQWVTWATTNIYNLKVLRLDAHTAYKDRVVLKGAAETNYKVSQQSILRGRTNFTVRWGNVGPRPYTITISSSKASPYSTARSTAVVQDPTVPTQPTLLASVVITFPDGTQSVPLVPDYIGGGAYQLSYTTKSTGFNRELWSFTDGVGSSAGSLNILPVSY